MKICVISDLHFDHITLGVARFSDVEFVAKQAVETAIREKCDRFVFLGDLCDPDKNMAPFRALAVAQEMALNLAACGIPSHWLAGNHDVIEDGTGSTTLTPMRAIVSDELIFLHEQPSVLVFEDPSFILAAFPFTSLSHTYDPVTIASDILKRPEPALVIGHLSIEGVIPGEETTEMPRGRDVVLPVGMLVQREASTLIMNGHYHRRQVTPQGVIIPGSAARLTFGEENNDPGFCIVEW